MKAIRCLLIALSALSTLTHAEHFNAYEQPSKPRRSLRSAAVVGGSSVSSGYDYIALIRDDGVCTGSLIAPTKVLTAAHCCLSKTSAYTVVLGAYKLKQDVFESFDDLRKEGKAVRSVSAVAYPSQYTGQTNSPYDVCVMTLSTSVTNITPVTIAAASDAKNVNVPVGSTVRAIGWGDQSDDEDASVSTLKAVDVTTTTCPAQQATGYICYIATGGASCHGDSGGPILAKPPGSTAYAIYDTVSGADGDKCKTASGQTNFDILSGTPNILSFIQKA